MRKWLALALIAAAGYLAYRFLRPASEEVGRTLPAQLDPRAGKSLGEKAKSNTEKAREAEKDLSNQIDQIK